MPSNQIRHVYTTWRSFCKGHLAYSMVQFGWYNPIQVCLCICRLTKLSHELAKYMPCKYTRAIFCEQFYHLTFMLSCYHSFSRPMKNKQLVPKVFCICVMLALCYNLKICKYNKIVEKNYNIDIIRVNTKSSKFPKIIIRKERCWAIKN